MKILSVDWAFHKTGLASYNDKTKFISVKVFEIPKKHAIKWWNKDFYFDYLEVMDPIIKSINHYDKVLVEVGFGKVDKFTLFNAWFYGMWAYYRERVEFIKSSEWIKECLRINHVNKLKKNQDKDLIKQQFIKRFNNHDYNWLTQDEIDAIMMLLTTYPNLTVDGIKKWE